MNLHENQNASGPMHNPFEAMSAQITELRNLVYKVLDSLQENQEDIIGVEDASILTNLKKGTIYNLSSKSQIPCIKRPGSRKLLFSRCALEAWILQSQKVVNISDKLLINRKAG